MKRILPVIALLVLAVVGWVFLSPSVPPVTLKVVAGSENEALEPLILDWGKANNVTVDITYLGSVDISRELGAGKASTYDAVWPAHSLWIELGDTQKVGGTCHVDHALARRSRAEEIDGRKAGLGRA